MYGFVLGCVTISGTGSTLDVTSAGSLTSLMDINHLAGVVNVDGQLESRKTAKIRPGQAVECRGVKVVVLAK